MRLLPALDLKVFRDFTRMSAQLAAIAVVIGCGLAVFLGMRLTMHSIATARSSYYASERFAHVFASLERAPESLERELREIPGVERVQTRVVAPVTLDVPGMAEAATARLISIPDEGRPVVNDIALRSGRLPVAGGRGFEAVASEAFALAHHLSPGASLTAVINGRRETVTVVGTALSPEYTYSLGPGRIFPDDRAFGVLWLRRGVLAPAFDMEGAFNDVSLRLTRETREGEAAEKEVIARVDEVLERFGGVGAYPRADQESAFFLENEIRQLDIFAWLVPGMFLGVAAFLLNVVMGRIVATQREQIAALKSFGYRDREVGLHYAKLVTAVVLVGCALGTGGGVWMAEAMVRLYAEYYRFPQLPLELRAGEIVTGVTICLAAGALGTTGAIRRTIRLPPAEGLRPEAPPVYRATLLERLGLERLVPPAGRIVLREIERQPRRALLSVVAISVATGMTVMNSFTFDSVNHMLNVHFGLNQRQDVQLTLHVPRPVSALTAFEHLPGVVHAEPYRNVPVRIEHGPRHENAAITGIPKGARLTALLDRDLRDVALPPRGLVLSRKLAELLDVGEGETVHVEVKEGQRPEAEIEVARIVDTFIGTSAHMDLEALTRMLGETPTMNGAWLYVDEHELDDLHASIKDTPIIAGVSSRDNVLGHARDLMDQSLGTFVGLSLSFSLVMAFGVLYNTARITLAERARELASLRVLGFHRREVAAILLGELGLLVLVSTPLGLVLGYFMAAAMASSPGYDTEQFRLPLIVYPSTYALATLTVLVAAIVSGWNAWRKLDRFDIVEVLKTRD